MPGFIFTHSSARRVSALLLLGVGLAALTLLYGTAITSLFIVLPRLGAGGTSSTVALNFEPIAVLAIAWVALGQAIAPLQVLGAFIVVGAIAWLSATKR